MSASPKPRALALAMIGLLVAAGTGAAADDVPSGCARGVTLLCADPAWPDADAAAPPEAKLTAKLAPAAPLPERAADDE